MTKLPAYAIHNGQATGEMLRLVAHALSSGAQGVARPGDLKVTASTAGNVKVAPGGALLPTQYVSSPQFQSYAIGMTSEATVPIPPTGSGSGATRYVIARIEDPQYGGQNMGSPNWDFNVVGSISALPYPFVPLAKITMPPSTSTITPGMITNLREVALPRSERHVVFVQNADVDYIQTSEYVNFITGYPIINVPIWAKRMIVRADIISVVGQNADVDGHLKVMFGNIDVAVRRFDIAWAGSTGRHDITIAGEVDISDRTAGTPGALQVRGKRAGGTGRLYADTQTSVMFEYEFIEAAA